MIRAQVKTRPDPEYNERRAAFATRELRSTIGRTVARFRARAGGRSHRPQAGRPPADRRCSLALRRRDTRLEPPVAVGAVPSPTPWQPMTRWHLTLRPFLICLPLLALPLVGSAQTVDTSGAGAIIAQAMDHSEVMANLRELSDVIGPRLSGSPAMRRANDWTAQRFRDSWLSATLEPYTFGVTWERGWVSLRLVAPFTRGMTAHSWAWTAGTGGRTLSGP